MEAGMQERSRLPFRPMDFGEILDYSFRLYRLTWKKLIAIGLVSAVPGVLMNGLMGQVNMVSPESSFFYRQMARMETGDFSGLALMGGLYLLTVALIVLVTPLVSGAIVAVTSRYYLGHETTVGEAFRIAAARYLPLLGTSVLFGLMMFIALPVLIIGGLLIFAIITVPAGYAVLITYFVFFTHVIVVEGAPGGVGALSRSARLVSGRFWPLLGLGVVFGLLWYILAMVIGLIAVLPLQLVQMFVSANPIWGWLSAILAGLGGAVTTPFALVGMTLAYYDTRMRKEGFDLEMLANTGVSTEP